MRFLILLPTFNRPKLLCNALRSIAESSYRDFIVAFIDDASIEPMDVLVRDILPLEVEQGSVVFYRIEPAEKIERQWGSSAHYMNRAIREIESDLVLFLCDDDALTSDYLYNASRWFENHPKEQYGFSHVIPYSPLTEAPGRHLEIRPYFSNHQGSVDPVNRLDSSQIVWRRSFQVDRGLWLNERGLVDLDANLWSQFVTNGIGLCPFMGFYGQYKGCHPKQLGHLKGVLDFNIDRDV